VLPAPWLRTTPRAGDWDMADASMITPQLEVLRELKERGLLSAPPPLTMTMCARSCWQGEESRKGCTEERGGGVGEGGSILERGGGLSCPTISSATPHAGTMTRLTRPVYEAGLRVSRLPRAFSHLAEYLTRSQTSVRRKSMATGGSTSSLTHATHLLKKWSRSLEQESIL